MLPRSRMKPFCFFLAFALILSLGIQSPAMDSPLSTPPTLGTTEIVKWPHDKKAVFLLGFDDSCRSAIQIVIPELIRRGMVGTFYINPGLEPYQSLRHDWEEIVPRTKMVYANHTFTHVGATSVEQLDDELRRCNEAIEACYPDAKKPRLRSFGQPGGVPWTVTPEEKNALLAKYHLIERPPFKGYPFAIKTQAEILALVDHALAAGGMDYHVFHGVGGDWHVTPVEMFTALLDKLDANQDRLWITDPVSWHQYVTERDSAGVKTLSADEGSVRLNLTCAADPAFYDLPLTLSMRVPAGWRQCRVVQGTSQTKATPTNGLVSYDATPGAGDVSITPVTD